MAKILFTWEMGSGLGHLRRFLPIAARLRQLGHAIAIAAPNPALAARELDSLGSESGDYDLVPAPVWQVPNDPRLRKIPTHTFADVLRLLGYYRVDKLLDMTGRWKAMIDQQAPDLVVADFSPTAALAMRGRVKQVVVGNGYTVPPGGRLLPPIRPWAEEIHAYSREHEGEAMMAINRVAMRLNDPPVDYLGDLFVGDRTYICSIREFDPYGAYRDGGHLFPFNIEKIDQGPALADRQGAPLSLYLQGGHTQFRIILEAIAATGLACDAYISTPPPDMAEWIGGNIRLHDRPLHLPSVLPQSRLLIHHAGLGTALAGLLAGTPQFVFSQNLEHQITAHGLMSFGSAKYRGRHHEITSDEIRGEILSALDDREIATAADETARRMARREREDGVATIVQGCLDLLAGDC